MDTPRSGVTLPRPFAQRRHRRLLAVLVAIGVGQAATLAVTGLGLARATDGSIAAGAAAAAAGAMTALLRRAERVVGEELGQRYVHAVRLSLFDQVMARAGARGVGRSHGGYLLRLVGDLSALRRWVSLGVARLVVAAVAGVGALATLVALAPLTAVVVGGVLLLGIADLLRRGPAMRTAEREVRRRRGRIASQMTEQVATSTGAGPRAAVGALGVVALLTGTVRDLGQVEGYRHGARVAREKIQAVLDEPATLPVAADAPPLVVHGGAVHVLGADVAGVLHDVDLHVAADERVAMFGPNGSGKSTLLAVLAGVLVPERGRVVIDGQDLAEHDPASLRREVGYVGPDLPLLRGSVRHNLAYRWPDAHPADLAEAARLARLHDVLGELPDGVDTRIREGGRGLSAGQRARVELARALLGAPRLLLLDEPDANLDVSASTVVDDLLEHYDGTIVVATHRPERLVSCDQVWCIADGSVTVLDPHDRDGAVAILEASARMHRLAE